MATVYKAMNISEVINRMDSNSPLRYEERERWEQLYTPSGRKDIDRMVSTFYKKTAGYKALFGGHSGNGKTTELSRFRCHPRILQKFFIIDFDVNQLLNPNDLEVVELLLVTYVEIRAHAEQKEIRIPAELSKRFTQIEEFFRSRLRVSQETSGVLGLKVNLFNVLRADAQFRKVIREEYRPRLDEITRILDDILLTLTAHHDERIPLIVIDGMDQMSVEKAAKLFSSDAPYVGLIKNASMLLTVPISVIHSPVAALAQKVFGAINTFKNIRLTDQFGEIDEEALANRQILRGFVLKRMDTALIDEKALDMAVHYSGGVFRTLVDLISNAAVNADVDQVERINERHVKDAANEMKIAKSRTLMRRHWEILQEVHENKQLSSNADTDTWRTLLQGLYALEYTNGDEWYDLNPLLLESLERFKSLTLPAEKKLIDPNKA
ncbi:MAG: hypothetical protein QNK37_23170 [Acidobacteriota bacterium]|nr:hypothetical protein [Acidobacteriota bacterium]